MKTQMTNVFLAALCTAAIAAAQSPVDLQEAASLIYSSSNYQTAKLIKRTEPAYPAVAKRNRVQGAVQLSAVIDSNGKLTNIQVTKGNAVLVPAAVEAVKQWRYEPSRIDQRPVPVATRIKVNFTMQN